MVWVLLIILLVLVGITVAAIALGARKRPDTCRPAQRVVRPKWLSFKFGGDDAAQTVFVNGLNNAGNFAQSRTNLIACEDAVGQIPGSDRALAVQKAIADGKIDRYLFRVLNPAMDNNANIVADLDYGDPAHLITIQANAIAEIALQLPPANSVNLLNFLAEGAGGGGDLGGIHGAIAIIQAMVDGWAVLAAPVVGRLEPRDRHDPAPNQAAMMLIALKQDNIFNVIAGNNITPVQIASMLATGQVSPNLVTALNRLSGHDAAKTAQIFNEMAALAGPAPARAAVLLARMQPAQAAQVLANAATRAPPNDGTLTAANAAAILAASVDGNIPALGAILELLVAIGEDGRYQAARIFDAMAANVNPASAPRAAVLLANMTPARAEQVLSDAATRVGPVEGTLTAAHAAVILAASVGANVKFGAILDLLAVNGNGCFHAANIFNAMAIPASAPRAAVLLASMQLANAAQVLADAANRGLANDGTLTAAHAATILAVSVDGNNIQFGLLLNALTPAGDNNNKYKAARIFNEMAGLAPARAAVLLASMQPDHAMRLLTDAVDFRNPLLDGTLTAANAAIILAASAVRNDAEFVAILVSLAANINRIFCAARIFNVMAGLTVPARARAAVLLANMPAASAALVLAYAANRIGLQDGTLTAANAAAILAASVDGNNAQFGLLLNELTPAGVNDNTYKAALIFNAMAGLAPARAAVLLASMPAAQAAQVLADAATRLGAAGTLTAANAAAILAASVDANNGQFGAILDALVAIAIGGDGRYQAARIFDAMAGLAVLVPARAAVLLANMTAAHAAQVLGDAAARLGPVAGTLTAANAAAILAASVDGNNAQFGAILDLLAVNDDGRYKAANIFNAMAIPAPARAAVLLENMLAAQASSVLNAAFTENNASTIINAFTDAGKYALIFENNINQKLARIIGLLVRDRAASILSKMRDDDVYEILKCGSVALTSTPPSLLPANAAAIFRHMPDKAFAALNGINLSIPNELYALQLLLQEDTDLTVRFIIQTPLDKNNILAAIPVNVKLRDILKDPNLPADLAARRLATLSVTHAAVVIYGLPDDQVLPILASMDATSADAILAAAFPAASAHAAAWAAQASRLRDLRAPAEPTPSVAWHPSAEPENVSVTFYAPSVYTVSESSSESSSDTTANATSDLSVNTTADSAAAPPPEKANSNSVSKSHNIFVIRPAENQNIASPNLNQSTLKAIPTNVKYAVVFAKGAEGASADLRREVETYLRAALRHHLDNKYQIPKNLEQRNAARHGVRAWLCQVRRGAATTRLELVATG